LLLDSLTFQKSLADPELFDNAHTYGMRNRACLSYVLEPSAGTHEARPAVLTPGR